MVSLLGTFPFKISLYTILIRVQKQSALLTPEPLPLFISICKLVSSIRMLHLPLSLNTWPPSLIIPYTHYNMFCLHTFPLWPHVCKGCDWLPTLLYNFSKIFLLFSKSGISLPTIHSLIDKPMRSRLGFCSSSLPQGVHLFLATRRCIRFLCPKSIDQYDWTPPLIWWKKMKPTEFMSLHRFAFFALLIVKVYTVIHISPFVT